MQFSISALPRSATSADGVIFSNSGHLRTTREKTLPKIMEANKGKGARKLKYFIKKGPEFVILKKMPDKIRWQWQAYACILKKKKNV